jgi:probable addiction module antidote protein
MNIKKSIDYQEYLLESLKDKEEAVGYLNAALEGGDVSVFLLALQNVVQAQGGITKTAQRVHKSRTSLYKTLSKKGNPYLETTNDILVALGMHLKVAPMNMHKT